jgi:hypothetical protein
MNFKSALIPGIIILAFSSCKKQDNSPEITSLSLSVSKNKIPGDGFDSTRITVVDQAGLDVKKYVTLYYEDKVFGKNRFQSTTPSISMLYSMFGVV